MKKLHRAKDVLLGMVLMTILIGLLGAASTQKNITVTTGIPIYVDGVEMHPTDANGNPVETFIYNGTTYVPLRAVSQYLGKAVNWDGSSRSVYIGKVPGKSQSLLNVCPPYQSLYLKTPATITMAGKKYSDCFTLGLGANSNWREGGWAIFALNGDYDILSFNIGHIDGTSMKKTTVTIYLDGELATSFDCDPEDLPKHYEIPLHGALQMKIVSSDNSHGFANVEIQ